MASNKIGYEKRTSEAESLRNKVGQRFRNLKKKKEMWSNLRIMYLRLWIGSSSTVRNISKRFRESGDVSVSKGHKLKSVLDDLQAITRPWK